MENLTQYLNDEDIALDQAENDLLLDEEKILAAKMRAEKEATYDHIEVWRMLKV